MKRALLVIDVQNAIVNFRDFSKEILKIEKIIHDFKNNHDEIVFMRHMDDVEESFLYRHSDGSEIHGSLQKHAEVVFEKQTPSSFFNTKLDDYLKDHHVEHLFIVGFNTEFCCMFTAIAAYDRGYKVTFIEDAIGTVNDGQTYEMQDLDINDFVGTVLHSTNVIEVLYYEEYAKKYPTD